MKIFSRTILLVAILCIRSYGQGVSDRFTVLKHWSDTPAFTIHLEGSVAYFGNDGLLEIVDFKDPLNPTELGRLALADTISAVALQDGKAYLGTVQGDLLIVDVDNHNNMRIISSFRFPFGTKNPVIEMALNQNFIYLFYRARLYASQRGVEGVLVLDASNIFDLHEAGSIFERSAQDMLARMPFLLLLDTSAINVYDASSNAENPVPISGYGFAFGPSNFAIEDTLLYTFTQDSLIVLNIADPYHLRHAGGSRIGDNPPLHSNLAVQNGIAYLREFSSLRTFDVNQPDSAFALGQIDFDGHDGMDLEVADSVAYIAQYDSGLRLINVADPAHPTELALFNRKLSFNSVVFKDNLAFAGFADGGLWVLDFWAAEGPELLSSYSGIEQESDMLQQGNRLFVTDKNVGLRILDISDPLHIRELGALSFEGAAGKMALSGDHLYVAIAGLGIAVIDVSDSNNPVEAGMLTGLEPTSLALENGLLCATTKSNGMMLYDVAASPSQLLPVGQYADANVVFSDIQVQDTYAYLAAGSRGLVILNVTDPANPVLAGQRATGRSVKQVRVSGEVAYAMEDSRVVALDISVKEVPKLQAIYVPQSFYEPNNQIRNIAVQGDTVYVSQNSSLYVLENSAVTTAVASKSDEPRSFELFQNYPNPFNPETSIRFQLPVAGHVVLQIFNIKGQRIQTLADADFAAGSHRVRWDGKDSRGQRVASGLYLYKLQIGDFSQVRKLSLLR